LTSALAGGEWSASRPGRFTPGEKASSTHLIGVWVDPRAGLDDVEKRKFFTLPGLELRPLGRPACSQSLYRLRYIITACLNVFVSVNIITQAKIALKIPEVKLFLFL
jgi:hypothetical protein